ncbi:uncharacterized protein A1O5_01762 [Cladophialophora psammophila CBS 110553]|uniref:3-oxoacyl-[acyl-carrier protein] reductase n=1 Tax=Cladophialophora psammophila CBS 110553 TaxID=1182543 RepID=W9XDM7_9EURO|nr:uncharacterized protein A1O5_01762 [Cladophialophora psammophila CBS 110553]EXJ75066.1 hypothetical protein A1O5_01762 [Cladophialophora psammophila CBS 110553]
MSNLFEGKVIAVTGAGSGMGLETARLLSARGACVAMCDANEETLLKARDSILETLPLNSGSRLRASVVDVRQRKQVDDWMQDCVDHFGKLDGAANIAGISFGGIPIEAMTDEVFKRVIDINLTGIMHCMRAQIPKISPNSGIVNVSSLAGFLSFGEDSPYVASKHGVIGLTKAAAQEVGDRGIRVNCVAPEFTQTPMLEAAGLVDVKGLSQLAIKRVGKPAEVAELIAFLLCDAASYITGSVNFIDGGWMSS